MWLFNQNVTDLCETLIVKNLIWLVPAAVCVKVLRMPLQWSINRMLTERIRWHEIVLGVCFVTIAVHILWLLTGDGISMFNPMFFVWAICAGVTEEILFRGILLNAQIKVWHPAVAILVNSLMFLLIHYTNLPFGGSVAEIFRLRGLVLLLIGVAFSVATIKTKCLKMPILMHTLWNTLVYFYGIY